MKSLISKLKKKGQALNIIGATVIGFMILIFMIFAVLYGISALKPSSFFMTDSAEANTTADLTRNLTAGVSTFGSYIPTVLTVLAVVLVLAGIAILILYVRRMNGGGEGIGGL